MKKFLLLSLLIVADRVYDITTTWLYTPDLSRETNIVVKLFGTGWPAVILFQAAVVSVVIYLLHHSMFRYAPVFPSIGGLTRKQFVSYLFFGDTVSFHKILYRMPTQNGVLYASTGYIAGYTLLWTSFIVGTSTTLLLVSETYKTWYRMAGPFMLYTIIVCLAAWFSFRFFNTRYSVYQNRAA